MIVASTLVALPLLVLALVARRLGSDLEETAWRLMAVAMLVTPLVSLLPKANIGLQLPFLSEESLFASRPQPGLPTETPIPIPTVVYAIVAIVLLARLAIAVGAAWSLRRNAKPFGRAYVCPSLRVPVTAGLVAPAILLPPDAPTWSARKLAAILAHERAHVARRDPLWRFIGRAATAVCWFHPLAWLAAASIERIAEESADQEAIAATGDRHEYANVILEFLRAVTGNSRRVLAVGMLDGRAIHTRIDAILRAAPTRRSRRVTRILLVILVAGAIFTTGMTRHEASPRAVPRAARQELTDPQLHRTRDEIRNRFRETLRETMRAIFGGFDFGDLDFD